MEARSAHHRRRVDVRAARPRQALVLLFRLHIRGLDGDGGEQLVPVGKAYFGFTDEELLQIDRFVRRNTTEKFGPVRHVVHEPDQGLVLEVAFEGLARSPRHKSGVAMRFPRISRLRWDKPPREADRLETLERMLKAEKECRHAGIRLKTDEPLTAGSAGSPSALHWTIMRARIRAGDHDAQQHQGIAGQPVTACTAFSAARRWRWRSG